MPELTTQQKAVIRDAVQDPCKFSESMLGTKLWSVQEKILRSVNTPYSRTAVKACHSSSKTFSAALATLWWLARWKEGIVVTTAPTWGQVERLLWGEVHSALTRAKYPFPKPTKTELKIGPKRYAVGISTSVTNQDEGVRFQGFHAEHVLMVFDEAPGVDPKIWQAAEGVRAGGDVRFLAQGNPTFSGGPFFDAFEKPHSGWNTFTISAFDTPNFAGTYLKYLNDDGSMSIQGDINGRSLLDMSDEELNANPLPYLITKRWVREKFYEWGPSSFLFESRVLGKFPTQSEDSLISLSWLNAAKDKREVAGKYVAGIDIAGPGEAETSLVIRSGPQLVLHKSWAIPDCRGELLAALMPYKDALATVNVDSAGIGWGMYLHLKDCLGKIVKPINVGESPHDGDKYINLKAELYWNLRNRFAAGEVSGLTDELTISQLASIRYKHTPQGKVQIEEKSDARKRGVPSPDRAESFMLAYADIKHQFGVLELMKQQSNEVQQHREEIKKLGTSVLIKPVVAPQTSGCPKCESKSLVYLAGSHRCNQCGHSWVGGPPKLPAAPGKRSEYLLAK